MNNSDQNSILEQAKEALDSGDCRQAYTLLLPLIYKREPEALYLYSTFSICGTETEKEFDERRIQLLHAAADAGYPNAIYSLGICYEIGDLVKKDVVLASSLFKKAAEAGHAPAKLSHGLDLFYGSNGIKKDEPNGLELIRQAADENVEEASEILQQISPRRTVGRVEARNPAK